MLSRVLNLLYRGEAVINWSLVLALFSFWIPFGEHLPVQRIDPVD